MVRQSRMNAHWNTLWLMWLLVFAFIGNAHAHSSLSMNLSPSHSAPALSTTILLEVFVDFYCPHCHDFHKDVLPQLQQEFGAMLEIREIAFPVVQGQTQEAFDLYEAAKAEGKGPTIASVIFRVLQEERKSLRNPQVRSAILQEVGLDPERIESHIRSGKAAKGLERGMSQAAQYGITFIPVAVVDRAYVLLDTSAKSISEAIHSVLHERAKP